MVGSHRKMQNQSMRTINTSQANCKTMANPEVLSIKIIPTPQDEPFQRAWPAMAIIKPMEMV